jgi:hypothetical protein
MAAKRGRKLRSSFVATFSLATGIAGCGVAEQPPSRAETNGGASGQYQTRNPPGFSGVGGAGGVSGAAGAAGTIAGAGGTFAGVGGFGANPPMPLETPCPASPPAEGTGCEGASYCNYNDVDAPNFDPCTGNFPTTAYCQNGVWVVQREEWSCNPPEFYDSGVIDEDAGQD